MLEFEVERDTERFIVEVIASNPTSEQIGRLLSIELQRLDRLVNTIFRLHTGLRKLVFELDENGTAFKFAVRRDGVPIAFEPKQPETDLHTPEFIMTPVRIETAEKFGSAIHHLTVGVGMEPTERNRAAGASFAIAQDHHAAIVFLMKNAFYSSSFALLRCLFEAYLRGLWLKYCASDAQVTVFFHGEEPPKTMLADIEATPAFSNQVLSRIKKESWRAMCSFTHTGGLHLQRWQSGDAIEPMFEAEELEECLNFAELIGAMAALELVQLAKSGDDGAAILELIQKRWP